MAPRGLLSIAPVNRPGGIAPAAIFFEAEASAEALDVERADHDPLYKWTFGETRNGSAAEFSTISRAASVWGRGNDTAYGPRVMHVFATPGLYTVTCEIWTERSEQPFDTAEITVEIKDPDRIYARHTAVLAEDGDFAGAPPGQRTTSIEEALMVVGEYGRLRLQRGSRVALSKALGGRHVMIDAWGVETEPKPILDASRNDGLVLGNFGGEFALRSVDIAGGCDPVTETGLSDANGVTMAGTAHVTLYGVKIRNTWIGIYPRMNRKAEPWSLGVANSAIRDWMNYGILCPSAYHVGWEGVVKSQNVDARGGGMGKPDEVIYNRHGPARYARPRPEGFVSYHNVEGFSCNGWSRAGNRPSYQPFIRWGSGGREGMRLVIDRLVAEGAGHGTLLNIKSFSGTDKPANTIIDKAILIECANSDGAILAGHGGITARNILIAAPHARRENRKLPCRGHIKIKGHHKRQSPQNRASWAHFYGLSVVDFLAPAEDGNTNSNGQPQDPALFTYMASSEDTFADVYVDNILYHAPHLLKPVVESPPPALALLFPPLYKGLRWHEELLDATTVPQRSVFETPAGTIVMPVPQPGSASYQGADLLGRIPIDDITGRLRLLEPSCGAVEP